ncbi:SDR family oxidoreductase [Halobacterium salinarum]|uniref:3-oxoacyl-[acyl-carrier protein] reductase n=1 Tax=Halobacterium salinarum (strain ATCC 33171 / DSM 3754 / JCM 8978 / NBRC 102687 / NCIMB 764 / 91-R6) TaxID=2597657 RepID=A0A4D6GVM8_HALS9|nr:SDR family oxidoreductase [Halobacterium salinarum]MDL0125767.1 SDR family oxidoreductase [Halobacterium salinarum]MDL0144769.1 SDR family oxidoreductase [Halobacterium salinarum]QCC45785.1 putative oxidoreductase (short-chain dehydrogenase family) [Halobacterium salinarum]TYO82043.1 3-oxoacyl-[acyl-carrier protein] reductase [Halobacterium salinarum DSM 3754]
MELGLDGDVAVVTASSSGLGKASAAALAREGADVVVCSRDEERVVAAAEEIGADADGSVRGVPADITDGADVTAVVETAVETFGGLDHVVTSAGGVPSGQFTAVTDDDWTDAFELLVMSVVRTLDAAHEHLVAGDGGTVTCITSTSVSEPIEGLVLSNAVRRGVVGLAKTVAREWAPEVRANVVQPGPHETARIEELVSAAVARGEADSYEAGLAGWSEEVPLDRLGEPSELGDVVAFLASDRASFVTGASVPVDGGRLWG